MALSEATLITSEYKPEPVTGPVSVITLPEWGHAIATPSIVTGDPVMVLSVPYIHCIHLVFTFGLSDSCGGTQLNCVTS